MENNIFKRKNEKGQPRHEGQYCPDPTNKNRDSLVISLSAEAARPLIYVAALRYFSTDRTLSSRRHFSVAQRLSGELSRVSLLLFPVITAHFPFI